jgi:hypothetical protein
VFRMQSAEELQAVNGNGNLHEPSLVGSSGDADELHPKPPVEVVHKVLVGIPLKGHTPPKAYHDRMVMFQHMGGREAEDFYAKANPRFVFGLGAVGEILVPFAREILAEAALRHGCEYLFMVDDDMLAPFDLFYKLQANNKDICAALAFTRNPDHKAVCYEAKEGWDASSHTHYGFTKFVQNYPRDQLFECDAVGFGAVLIRTEVFKRVKQPWFFGMERTGEDVTLCTKAKRAGFEVWMDSRIKLGHLGEATIITEDYADQWQKLTLPEREKLYGNFTKYSASEPELFKCHL